MNSVKCYFQEFMYFEGMFTLQVKEKSHLFKAPLSSVAYDLQEPLREELD